MKNFITVTYTSQRWDGTIVVDSFCTDNSRLENLDKMVSCYSASLGYNPTHTKIIEIEPYENDVQNG